MLTVQRLTTRDGAPAASGDVSFEAHLGDAPGVNGSGKGMTVTIPHTARTNGPHEPRGGWPAIRAAAIMNRQRMVLVLAIAVTTACSQPVDVAKAVQVRVVTSGWLPAAVVDGKNKIVPSVSMTLKNVSSETLNALQVNAIFRLVSTNDEIGSDFRPATGASGLPATATTEKIVLKAARGYTGADPYEELLNNSQFVDARVEVFLKTGSGQWTRVGEYTIARMLTGD